MAKKSTFIWRIGILGLLATAVPLGIYVYEEHNKVNTEAMLDVSVSIKTVSHVRIDSVGDSVWKAEAGSGFLVDAERCEVWTNHHVIANAAFIEVFPRGWQGAHGLSATVVNATPRSDVAVLRMAHCEAMAVARLGSSAPLQPGEETYAVGNPLGSNPDSISRGIVSHTERYVDSALPYLQTDAAINPGNSGGALFNHHGEVVGINTAIATVRGSNNLGIGYALPIDVVKAEVARLRAGPPSWGDAGLEGRLSVLSAEEAAIFGVPAGYGAVNVTKTPSEGASAGQLRARDIIFKINDRPVTGVAQVQRLITGHEAGETVTFELVRDGERHAVAVTLAEGWQPDEQLQADHYEGHLGLSLAMWTDEDGEKGQFKTPVITHVQSLGPAHRGRITSSQNYLARRGPFLMPYVLDVKTVTGVVLEGAYHAVDDVDELDDWAAQAFAARQPMLLEIEIWRRANPQNPDTSLEHASTAFYIVKPALTAAATPTETVAESTGEESTETATTPAKNQTPVLSG